MLLIELSSEFVGVFSNVTTFQLTHPIDRIPIEKLSLKYRNRQRQNKTIFCVKCQCIEIEKTCLLSVKQLNFLQMLNVT